MANKFLNTFPRYEDWENYFMSDNFWVPNVAYIIETEEVEIVSECQTLSEWRNEPGETICDGGNLYQLQRKYESDDCGHEWYGTEEERPGALIETGSTQCAAPVIKGTVTEDYADDTYTFILNSWTENPIEITVPVDENRQWSYTWQEGDTITDLSGAFQNAELESIDEWTVPVEEDVPTESMFEDSYITTAFFYPGQTVVGEREFAYTPLTSVEIPSSVTEIGKEAFTYSMIESVTIPETVTAIGDEAFSGCDSLTALTLPASLTTIGREIDMDCSNIESVTVLATTPPQAGRPLNSDGSYTIFVPSGSVDAYKSAWSYYEDRIEPIPVG